MTLASSVIGGSVQTASAALLGRVGQSVVAPALGTEALFFYRLDSAEDVLSRGNPSDGLPVQLGSSPERHTRHAKAPSTDDRGEQVPPHTTGRSGRTAVRHRCLVATIAPESSTATPCQASAP